MTRSAISAGAMTVRSDDPASQAAAATISRDPGTANAPLEREFTADKRAGLERGFNAARTLGGESATFLADRGKEADDWTRDHPDADPSDNPYATWVSGGTGQLALTALTGAAGGDVGGSLGGLAQGVAAGVAQGLATRGVKGLVGKDDEHPVLRALAQGAVACAGSMAGGAGSCGGAALGAATSVGLHELLKTGATPAVDADGDPLTQAEAQRREAIVATVAGVAAGAAGLDPGAAITGANVETENNSLKGRNGKVIQPQRWQLKDDLDTLLRKDAVRTKLEKLAEAPPYNGDVAKLYAAYTSYADCATSATRTCPNDPVFDEVASTLVDASGAPHSALLDSIGQHVAEIVEPSTLANMANAPGAELRAAHSGEITWALERDPMLREPGLQQEAAVIGLAAGAGFALAMGARGPEAPVLATPIHTPELGNIGTNAVDPDDRSRGQYEAFPSLTPQVQLPGLTPDFSSSVALPGCSLHLDTSTRQLGTLVERQLFAVMIRANNDFYPA